MRIELKLWIFYLWTILECVSFSLIRLYSSKFLLFKRCCSYHEEYDATHTPGICYSEDVLVNPPRDKVWSMPEYDNDYNEEMEIDTSPAETTEPPSKVILLEKCISTSI